ncbi:hypothetical protein FPRO05_03029 [Fusarium proliferatum]|uniref:Nephrocystin 3-like N-terminal domain-containing protein n=1 Tax=Gibberella intermedia TaxID=948311 RepID=A0A365N0A8_GIBIN|nr:hypothetical protein FPRO05_03029 [Fusarium proliferatum]
MITSIHIPVSLFLHPELPLFKPVNRVMSDSKRSYLKGFIKRLNPGKAKESNSVSTGTLVGTSPSSPGRVPADLPSASTSSSSATSVNIAVTRDPLRDDVSVGCSTVKAKHDDSVLETDHESKKQQSQFQQLWKEAIDNIRASKDGEKLSEVIRLQEQASAGNAQMSLPALIKRLEIEMKRFGTQKRLAEAMEKIVPHLNRFAVVSDIAISTNPNPAALPWAAVRFLLLNLTAGEEIRSKVVEGIAEITLLVFECSVYHELYLDSPASTDLPINKSLRQTIIDALSHCIKFLGYALHRQQVAARALTDAFRLDDFARYLKDLIVSKDKLHNAVSLREMHHSSQTRYQLRSLHDLMIEMRLESSERAEESVKSQLRDLLIDPKDAFDHLYHPHDSYCLEGTRVQVLYDIEQWAHDPTSPTICWLPGLAGTGKSTISRTVSRNIKTKGLGASFFFKKGAGNRGNGRHMFSILAYQLALNFPRILPHIMEAVKEDHSLNIAPIQIQWQKLVLNPLVKLQDEGLTKPIVFVLDALYKCDEQDRGEIFRLLLATCPRMLRVFLISQADQSLVSWVGAIETDFRVYLRQTMEGFVVEYNRTHRQKHMQLSSDWPGEERFELLLHKALPLFITAATFVRMICDRHWEKSPDYKIDVIIDNSSRVNSAYEALYKPVLSLSLASPLSIISLARLLGVDARSISSQVDPLRSVIDVPEDDSPLQLFHLSFRDYILSKSAVDLQVSEIETQARLASRCLGLLQGTLKVDICGLLSPGKSLSDIEPSAVEEHVSPEIQRIRDDDDTHIFLQSFFTNWLEVLCLLRRLDDSLRMLQDLQSMVDETSGARVLHFIQDAIQFIRYFRVGIEETPLQIYHSGSIFSPKESIIPAPLKDRHYPDYTTKPFNADSNWPQSQTLQIWNLDSGACGWSFTLTGCSSAESIAFSDDRKFICSVCTRDLEVIMFIHSLDTGKCVSEFEIPDKPGPMLLSPKGQWIAAIAKNSILLSRWSYSEKLSWTLLGHQHEHGIVMFSSDGTLVASLSSTSQAVKVWSTESSKCLHTLRFEAPIVQTN